VPTAPVERPHSDGTTKPVFTYYIFDYEILERIAVDDAVAASPVDYRGIEKGGRIDGYCTVSKTGQMQACTYVPSVPNEGLENVGIAFAKAFRVAPTMKSGKPSAGTRAWFYVLLGKASREWHDTYNPDGSKKQSGAPS